MNYENIYESFYSKYYSKAEGLIKNFFIKRQSQKRTFGSSYNEVIHYLSNDFKNRYNLYKNENLENSYRIFCRRQSIYFIDDVQEIFENDIKVEFDRINVSELPANYTYLKFIKEIALIEAIREISRLLSNNSVLLTMFYKLNEFDDFEIREYRRLPLEDYPIYRKLHSKLYPKQLEYLNAEVINSEKNDLDRTSNSSNYLGQASNEKANELFDFLIQYYRPDEKTSVKFVNILHYLKNDVNKELYIFNVKQPDFMKMIKIKVNIEIKKFAKSGRYNEDEKPILNTLESSFRKKKS